jgi:hypothetical protein
MYTNIVVTKTPVADLMEVAMKVGDILRQKTARIATVRMNETVGIAALLMRASNISALVVKDVEPRAIPRPACLPNAMWCGRLPSTARPASVSRCRN